MGTEHSIPLTQVSTPASFACLCELPELCIIRVAGEDREKFLQGQLSNDIARLGTGLMLAGYCTPQGRLLATPRLFAQDSTIGMIVPADLADALIKRLKLYILRANVTLAQDKSYRVVGIVGTIPDAVRALAGVLLFEQTDAAVQTRIGCALPQGRALAVVPAGLALGQPAAPASVYQAAAIGAGEPSITAAASGAYVPQAINLELIDGVNFKKGCYTGQEVVSRVEHIGKTARRAALFAAQGQLDAPVGAPLTNESGQACGSVINSVYHAGRTLLLAQCSVDSLDHGAVQLQSVPLTRLPLPYSYERTAH